MDRLQKAVSAARALSPRSKSPGATNANTPYEMGKTASGKSVMSHPTHESHKDFTSKDHADAYKMHTKKLSTVNPYHTTTATIEHHRDAMVHHFKGMNDNLLKSEDNFDHHKAMHDHHKKALEAAERMIAMSKKGSKHNHKTTQVLMAAHGDAVHRHHAKTHKEK